MIPPSAWQIRAETAQSAYVYLLCSISTNRFYLGWTTDVKRRLDEHNSGDSFYTKTRGPWELIGYEMYPTADLAKRRERTLKHNPRMLSLFKKRALVSLRIRRLEEVTTFSEIEMIPPPPFIDAKHRELGEFQKRAVNIDKRAFVKEVVG